MHKDDYEHDLFISYAHADTGEDWIPELKSQIQVLFSNKTIPGKSSRGIDIFIDYEDLGVAGRLDKELIKHIKGSKVLLIILSDSYINSQWCNDELSWFEKFNNRLDFKNIYIIQLHKIRKEIPEKIDGILGAIKIHYFDDNEGNNEFGYAWPNYEDAESNERKKFHKKTKKLANNLISYFANENTSTGVDDGENIDEHAVSNSIYLSPISYFKDTEKWRELRNELRKRKWIVYPDEEEIKNSKNDPALFRQLFEDISSKVTTYIQIANIDLKFKIEGEIGKTPTTEFDLLLEWNEIENKVNKIQWRDPDFNAQLHDGDVKDYFTRFKAKNTKIIDCNSVYELLDSLFKKNIPQGNHFTIVTNYDQKDDPYQQLIVEVVSEYFLNKYEGDKVDELANLKTLRISTDVESKTAATQEELNKSMYKTLEKSSYVIFLMCNKDNENISKDITYYNKLFYKYGDKPFTVHKNGAVVVWPRPNKDYPIPSFAKIKGFDCKTDLIESIEPKLDEYARKTLLNDKKFKRVISDIETVFENTAN